MREADTDVQASAKSVKIDEKRQGAELALKNVALQQEARTKQILSKQEPTLSLKAWLGILTPKDSAALTIQTNWKASIYRKETLHNTLLEDAVSKWTMKGMFDVYYRRQLQSCIDRFDAKQLLKSSQRCWGALRQQCAFIAGALSFEMWINFARDHQLLHQMCDFPTVASEFRLRACNRRLDAVIGGVKVAFGVLQKHKQQYNSSLAEQVVSKEESTTKEKSDSNDQGVGESACVEEVRKDIDEENIEIKIDRSDLLSILIALGAPSSLSEERLEDMGCIQALTATETVQFLRRYEGDPDEIEWEAASSRNPGEFDGIDFDGFESCVEKMIDIRRDSPIMRAFKSKNATSDMTMPKTLSPDNKGPTAIHLKKSTAPPSRRNWRYQSMISKRAAIAVGEKGSPVQIESYSGSAREEHMSTFIYNILSPLSQIIARNEKSGTATAVEYLLGLPGVVNLILEYDQEIQICYDFYVSRNGDGHIRYEDFLDFAVRTGSTRYVPNDLSSNFLLLRTFLACKSGNQLGIDLNYDDFHAAESLAYPSVGIFKLKSRSRWELRYKELYFPPADNKRKSKSGFSRLFKAMLGRPYKKMELSQQQKGPSKDPDTEMIPLDNLEAVLSKIGFIPLPGELLSLRKAFMDPKLRAKGELSARQLHRQLFAVRATSILLRDFRLTKPEFSICIVLLSHVLARLECSTFDGLATTRLDTELGNKFFSCGSTEKTLDEIRRTFRNIRIIYKSPEIISNIPKMNRTLDKQLFTLLRKIFEQRRDRAPMVLEHLISLTAEMACFPLLATRGSGLYFIRELGLSSSFEFSDAEEFIRIMERVIVEELSLNKLNSSEEDAQRLKLRLTQRLRAMVEPIDSGSPNLDSLVKHSAVDRQRMNIARKIQIMAMNSDLQGHTEAGSNSVNNLIGFVDFWSGCYICMPESIRWGQEDNLTFKNTVSEVMSIVEKNKPRSAWSSFGIIDVAEKADENINNNQRYTQRHGLADTEEYSPSDIHGKHSSEHAEEKEICSAATNSNMLALRKSTDHKDDIIQISRRKKKLQSRKGFLTFLSARNIQNKAPDITMDQMSPQELFIAGERCLHARRDEMAFSFLEKAIKNLKGNELSDITHEKQIFVFSKLLSRQVKSGHLVARSLSQAFRAQARAIKHENAEKAYAALQKQQRVADKYDLVVEKAYGAESLGVAICILRLGCDVSRQPEYSLVLPSSGNAEQVLILNTKLFDRADLSLWLMAQEAPPLNTTGFSRKDVNMKNILKESSSVATNTMPFGPIIADSRISDRSNTESACSEAIGYFDFMLKVARKYNKYGMQRDAHQLLSQCYLIRNEHHLALMHAKIFDDMSRDNELQRIVSLQQLGRVHLEFGEFDAATETWKILLDQCNQSKRTEPQVPQRHRIRQHVRKESRKLMNPCTHLASTYCFLGKTHFLAGDYYAALEDFRSQLKFAHNELCIIVAELNIAFTLRSLGEPQQLKSALALYNKYLSWSMAEKTRDNFHTKDPGNRVLTSMETHARFCLSEIHTALGETSTALVNQKKLGSLTCLHGDINTLGEIYARRAIGELMSVNLQPSSLLDDSDDEI